MHNQLPSSRINHAISTTPKEILESGYLKQISVLAETHSHFARHTPNLLTIVYEAIIDFFSVFPPDYVDPG